MYLIHEFHNVSWITEINELFYDILIYWDAPVYIHTEQNYKRNTFVLPPFFMSWFQGLFLSNIVHKSV